MTPYGILGYGVTALVPVLLVELLRRLKLAPIAMHDSLYVVGPRTWFDTAGVLHEAPAGLLHRADTMRERARARAMLVGELPRWELVPGGLWRPKGGQYFVNTAGPDRLEEPADRLIIRRQGFQSRLDTGEDVPAEMFNFSMSVEPGMVILKAAWACAFPLDPAEGEPRPFGGRPGAPWVQPMRIGDVEQSSDFVFVWALWLKDARKDR